MFTSWTRLNRKTADLAGNVEFHSFRKTAHQNSS